MTAVCIIDPNPDVRSLIRRAFPADWILLEAGDALSGLSRVRERLPHLDAVIINVQAPGFDGRLVCAQVRALDVAVRLLPIIRDMAMVPFLTELGCLLPLTPPINAYELAERLQAALHEPPRPFTQTAAFRFTQDQAAVIERQARESYASIRVVVFASSLVKRAGIARVFTTMAVTDEASNIGELRHLLRSSTYTALVADAGDYEMALAEAQQSRTALLVVARTLGEARTIPLAEVAGVAWEADPDITMHLHTALTVIAEDKHASLGLLGMQINVPVEIVIPPIVAEHLAACNLLKREQEVLWLDFQGWSDKAIADHLVVARRTITAYRGRALGKLNRDRQEARIWLRQLIRGGEAQENAVQERSAAA